uniref:Pleckstrin homology domain containing, family O member 1a n=1 Tax=Mastacembelus armatus TaxID=205130 RepID=A0A3Q3N9I0_9TELE
MFQGIQDLAQQTVQLPEKVGWIRKFYGRGIFRELWRSRYVVLRGDQLYISDKEVKDEHKAQEVFHLADYDRSEELRKAKSRSKKNHSRFTLLRCRQPGNTVPNLVFLAVSPEEKESWVNALNVAIIKAKNRVLDEVTIEEDSVLVHPTRDRAKIPHGRRLPSRGHLMAVASTSSHGMLMLDLVAEEDGFSPDYNAGSRAVGGRQRAGTDVSKLRMTSKEPRVKTGSLPRGSERSWGKQSHLESRTPQPGKRFSMLGRSRCASMDEVLSSREEESGGGASVPPVGQLHSLIAQRMQRAQELLEEMRLSPYLKGIDSPRLHHLRGSDSPHSRGSQSPASKTSDSPRLKDSSCLTSTDSPRSKRSNTVLSPKLKGPSSSSGVKEDDYPVEKSPKSSLFIIGSSSSQVRSSDSIRGSDTDSPHVLSSKELPCQKNSLKEHLEVEWRRAEAERLLEEAVSSWKEAQQVLQEVKELQSQTLRRQHRRTYEKMTSTAAVAAKLPASEEDDTPASPTSPEDDKSKTT